MSGGCKSIFGDAEWFLNDSPGVEGSEAHLHKDDGNLVNPRKSPERSSGILERHQVAIWSSLGRPGLVSGRV